MPASTARQVVIDDNDLLIQYSSGWQLHSSNKKDDQGNYGPTLDSTLHLTQSNGSFNFNFSGTEIDVFGTTDGMNSDPTWTCSVDGSDIIVENPPPSQSTENNSLLCSAQDLPDASHNLTVTVYASPQHNFFFDYLRYTPSNSEDFNDALVFVPFGNPDIIYQGNWDPFDNATITSTEGSSATIKFTGISAQWYGILSPKLPTSRSQASYSIDGGPNNPLVLNGPQKGQQIEQFNQRIFETPVLPFGPHNITVNFDSTTDTSTPLTLTYLLVQNETLASPVPSSSQVPTSTPFPVSSLSGVPKKTNVAGIVGGLLGSILLLCLLAFLIFQYRKHRNAKWEPRVLNPFKHRRSIPRPIETGSISTLNLFGTSTIPSLPIRRPESQGLDRGPQPDGSRPNVRESRPPSEPANLDENASYYGGYQTWGQAKALEAASGSRQRDSYV